MCYCNNALKEKSNYIIYTSESGIVRTDYKCLAKEHSGANYQKRLNSSRLVRKQTVI